MKITTTTLLIAFCCLVSCSVDKNISVEKTDTERQALKEKSDSIRVLTAENSRLQQELRETQYAGVQFDSSDCPPSQLIIPENCNADSLKALIHGLTNRVKIYADGTIEAQGRLRSANFLKDVVFKQLLDVQRRYDSLYQSKQKEKIIEKTVTVTKEKEVKRWFMPWWFWLLLPVCIIGGYYFKNYITKKH